MSSFNLVVYVENLSVPGHSKQCSKYDYITRHFTPVLGTLFQLGTYARHDHLKYKRSTKANVPHLGRLCHFMLVSNK